MFEHLEDRLLFSQWLFLEVSACVVFFNHYVEVFDKALPHLFLKHLLIADPYISNILNIPLKLCEQFALDVYVSPHRLSLVHAIVDNGSLPQALQDTEDFSLNSFDVSLLLLMNEGRVKSVKFGILVPGGEQMLEFLGV